MGIDVLDEDKLKKTVLEIEDDAVRDFMTQILPAVTAYTNATIAAVFSNADKLLDKATKNGQDTVAVSLQALSTFRDDTFDRLDQTVSRIKFGISK